MNFRPRLLARGIGTPERSSASTDAITSVIFALSVRNWFSQRSIFKSVLLTGKMREGVGEFYTPPANSKAPAEYFQGILRNFPEAVVLKIDRKTTDPTSGQSSMSHPVDDIVDANPYPQR
jgi:hypothetical protein